MIFVLLFLLDAVFMDDEAPSNFLTEIPEGFKPYKTPKSFVNDLVKEAQKYHPQSVDNFGQTIFVHLNGEKKDVNENILLSPYSLSLGLQVAAAGANSNTFSEFIKTLDVPNVGSSDALLRNQGMIMSAKDKKKAFTAAFSVWINNKYNVYKSYVTSVKNAFNASVYSLDFSSSDGAAAEEINSWVSKVTKKAIKSVVNDVKKDDVMLLVNTLYFKGAWDDEFNAESTTPGDFTRADGSVQSAMLMHTTQKLDYYSDEYIQAVVLPFDKGPKLLVILPKDTGSIALDAVAKKYLVHDRISHILFNIFYRKVNVELPRFNVTYTTSLKDALAQGGLKSAFSDDADFSFISPQKVKISDILHQVTLSINEAGAQMATATAVKASATDSKSSRSDDSLPFTANRPFVYALLNEKTALLTGIVRDLGTEVQEDTIKKINTDL